MNQLPSLSGARVLVWGLGQHGGGLAAARLCAHAGARVEILDAKPADRCGADGANAIAAGFTCHVGDASHPAFTVADLIVPSPAIPPRAWPTTHPPIISAEALVLSRHCGPRIAVTGTKGKSTTAMILGKLLDWPVVGNSWRPLAEHLLTADPAAPLVCELSSFQLWYLRDLQPRFDAAILTMLAVDHLDWHPNADHYRTAKTALLHWSHVVAIAPSAIGLVSAELNRLPEVFYRDGAFFDHSGSLLAQRVDLPPPGDHNAANACLALSVALHLGIDRSVIAPRLRSAEPLPHRLRPVHANSRLTFIDDSIATTPESAMAALASFAGPLAIILGGSDKGAEFAALASAVAKRHAKPVLIGTTAQRLAVALREQGIAAPIATDMDEAVKLAATAIGTGTVLLSPGCASLDMFHGFDHRGNVFADAARRLFDPGSAALPCG